MALHRYFKISSKLPGSQWSPLFNRVPPEVNKAANKIVKQATNEGGILKAQQQKYSVSRLQSNASSNSSVGLGSPCGYDATSLFAIVILDWCALK